MFRRVLGWQGGGSVTAILPRYRLCEEVLWNLGLWMQKVAEKTLIKRASNLIAMEAQKGTQPGHGSHQSVVYMTA